jgi:hypothetical protein
MGSIEGLSTSLIEGIVFPGETKRLKGEHLFADPLPQKISFSPILTETE